MKTSFALQQRLVQAIRASGPLQARKLDIYTVPPPDARPPYLVIGLETVLDWSWKGGGGDDHRFQLTLWDANEDVALTKMIASEIESAVLEMPRVGAGMRIVSLTRVKTTLRRRPKQWTESISEFRALAILDQ
jgi:hypothetical protein